MIREINFFAIFASRGRLAKMKFVKIWGVGTGLNTAICHRHRTIHQCNLSLFLVYNTFNSPINVSLILQDVLLN